MWKRRSKYYLFLYGLILCWCVLFAFFFRGGATNYVLEERLAENDRTRIRTLLVISSLRTRLRTRNDDRREMFSQLIPPIAIDFRGLLLELVPRVIDSVVHVLCRHISRRDVYRDCGVARARTRARSAISSRHAPARSPAKRRAQRARRALN